MRHFTLRRFIAAFGVGTIAVGGLLVTAPAAHAEERTGDVTVSIPSKIVLDGRNIAVKVTGSDLYSSLDRVYMNLYIGDALQTTDQIEPNTSTAFSTDGVSAGSVIGRADLATTECNTSSDDPCHLNTDGDYYYEFVDGLSYHDSSPAVAKYGSKVALTAVRTNKKVTWTASVQRYAGYEWKPWSGATVTIGPKHVLTNSKGLATFVEKTAKQHRYHATIAETTTIWGGASSATTPKKAARAPKVTSSSSAATIGRAMQFKIPSIGKVKKLNARTDPNGLLGRPNGYSSAAVLYDSRTSCSDGPGADCGATIERWPSAAKAKARSKYILGILDAAPSLGSEYHAIEGRFLLRISGDLTPGQARIYKKVFRALL